MSDSAEDFIRDNEEALNGRQVILKFKRGGKIKEEHIYDSADQDWESQFAIHTFLWLIASKKGGGIDLGAGIIGKGFNGLTPWQAAEVAGIQNLDTVIQKAGGKRKASLEFMTPIRVADVVGQPTGTVLVTLESS